MKQLRIPKGVGRLVQVSVSATNATIELLDALAVNEGRTRSAQARHIIMQAVRSKCNDVTRRNKTKA